MRIHSVEYEEFHALRDRLYDHNVTLILSGSFLPKFEKLINEDLYILPIDALLSMSKETQDEMRRAIDEYNHLRKETSNE